ncbi:YesN/AraC family two-component response regulator [Acetoanaerobium pronyense]|uniref:Stage 0 sporulation protein A homolog n=1 Tax=Acetoanaerobium pronyense TaxID=1482736 RepID=A0ABS4KHK4_9FIRM|nr:Na-translocating system protein MpsC family protein [Acetoanaerobium pronyense]MBP2027266.1 YesN/AraC family two-component response regulator [Acetoanaerobium pronyense]
MANQEGILKNIKLLYVEDEEEVVEQMSFLLKKRLGKLRIAKNGKEGFDMFMDERPDIILSDLKMPIMDGITMAREIRRYSKTPIIITTAFSDKDIILKAIDVGIEKYIIKPINPKELLESLEKVAKEILSKRGSIIMGKDGETLGKEEKLKTEEDIKNSVAKLIKEKTGKGPKTVKAFIHMSKIEIEVFEGQTKLEKNLAQNPANHMILKYIREAVYRDYTGEIFDLLKEVVKGELSIESIDIDILNDRETIVIGIL